MKLSNLKNLSWAVALCGLCACSGNKEYTINGTIDLPDTIAYEDTILTVPSMEGMTVYLFDLENQVVDSATISQNQFQFEGNMGDDEEAFFVQFVSPVGGALLVVEPGDIDVRITAEKTYISGTPANQCISDTDDVLTAINQNFGEKVSQLVDSLQATGQEPDMELQMSLYGQLVEASNSALDSLYSVYKDNIGVGYIVMLKHSDFETAEELEDALSEYPESIQQNPFVLINLKAQRQYQQAMAEQGMDPEDIDPDTIEFSEEEVTE